MGTELQYLFTKNCHNFNTDILVLIKLFEFFSLILGHPCAVPAKQHQHLLLFLTHRCPKIGENCPKFFKNSLQMVPKIKAFIKAFIHAFYNWWGLDQEKQNKTLLFGKGSYWWVQKGHHVWVCVGSLRLKMTSNQTD